VAERLLRSGVAEGHLRVPHQAIVEFLSVATRPLKDGTCLLEPEAARREAEELLLQFEVLYPTEPMVRLAIRGMATYGLAWLDAHLWAYAEHFGLPILYSEDFQAGRVYGTTRVVNPFA
jgi:predicted nucleic acid-binding protein